MVCLTSCRYYSSSDEQLIKVCLTTAWILNALSIEESIQAIWVFLHDLTVNSNPLCCGLWAWVQAVVQIAILFIKPSIRSKSQLCHYAMWNPPPPTPYWCWLLQLSKTPSTPSSRGNWPGVQGWKRKCWSIPFFLFFFCFFFIFHSFCSLFLYHQECLHILPPPLSTTAGFSPHLRLWWLTETLNNHLHGWTVSIYFFSFKQMFFEHTDVFKDLYLISVSYSL